MLNKQRKLNGGFTIIEVMIVLAIAGLILLIVFLAVPALQRSQRNTSRKADAGHIETAVNDFVSNNNGSLPGNTGGNGLSWAADCATIISDAGTLSQYNSANSFGCGGSALTAGTPNKFEEEYGAVAAIGTVANQAMVLDEDATCPTSSNANPETTVGANTNDSCLLYTIEGGGGTWNWNYIQL